MSLETKDLQEIAGQLFIQSQGLQLADLGKVTSVREVNEVLNNILKTIQPLVHHDASHVETLKDHALLHIAKQALKQTHSAKDSLRKIALKAAVDGLTPSQQVTQLAITLQVICISLRELACCLDEIRQIEGFFSIKTNESKDLANSNGDRR